MADVHVTLGLPVLTQGSDPNTGPTVVKHLQLMLNERGGFPVLTEDGVFGSSTETSVKHYQQNENLTVDGVVGKQTWTVPFVQMASPVRARLRRQILSPSCRKNATAIKNDPTAFGQANRYGGGEMTVYPFVRESVFEPEIIQVMAGAYEELLDDLHLAGRDDPFTEVIAREVIEAARLGVHDVAAMRQWVLNTLGKPH